MNSLGYGGRSDCLHEKLHDGGFHLRQCPDCDGWFVARSITVIGSCQLPVPYLTIELMPSNNLGWYCGDGINVAELMVPRRPWLPACRTYAIDATHQLVVDARQTPATFRLEERNRHGYWGTVAWFEEGAYRTVGSRRAGRSKRCGWRAATTSEMAA